MQGNCQKNRVWIWCIIIFALSFNVGFTTSYLTCWALNETPLDKHLETMSILRLSYYQKIRNKNLSVADRKALLEEVTASYIERFENNDYGRFVSWRRSQDMVEVVKNCKINLYDMKEKHESK